MKTWKEQTNKEKLNSVNTFIDVYKNLYAKIALVPNQIQDIHRKILASENDSFRDFIILFLLDKGYTVSDGFHFFNAAGFNFTEEDCFTIMAEKLDITYDQMLAYHIYSMQYIDQYTMRDSCKYVDIQMNSLNKEAQFLFEDLTTRIEIFVEVHDEKYKSENPTRYMELLNSPITSLLSIKLSKNERITKALRKRLGK